MIRSFAHLFEDENKFQFPLFPKAYKSGIVG